MVTTGKPMFKKTKKSSTKIFIENVTINVHASNKHKCKCSHDAKNDIFKKIRDAVGEALAREQNRQRQAQSGPGDGMNERSEDSIMPSVQAPTTSASSSTTAAPKSGEEKPPVAI